MGDCFFQAKIQYVPPLKGEGDRFSGGEVLFNNSRKASFFGRSDSRQADGEVTFKRR